MCISPVSVDEKEKRRQGEESRARNSPDKWGVQAASTSAPTLCQTCPPLALAILTVDKCSTHTCEHTCTHNAELWQEHDPCSAHFSTCEHPMRQTRVCILHLLHSQQLPKENGGWKEYILKQSSIACLCNTTGPVWQSQPKYQLGNVLHFTWSSYLYKDMVLLAQLLTTLQKLPWMHTKHGLEGVISHKSCTLWHLQKSW